jgi:hypothetical protein
MLDIEEQIADVYVTPAPEKRICAWEPRPGYPACTTPLAQANRESLCYRHTQLERTLKTMKDFSRTVEPEQTQERAEPKELRLCAVKDCHRKLAEFNTSGRCSRHFYIKQGMQMKDGSIPRPATIPTPALIAPLRPIEPIAPIEALQPIQPEEEMTPVTEEVKEDVRAECAVMGCTALLMSNNSTGRCKNHGYLKQGMQLKDGTIPKPKKDRVVKVEPGEPKECAVMHCRTALANHNRTGRCNAHYVLQRGMQLKDGSVPRPHTAFSLRLKQKREENAAAGAPLGGEVTRAISCELDDKEIFTPLSVVLAREAATVSLKVPIEAINQFLLNMSTEDKTRIVERAIFGGQ